MRPDDKLTFEHATSDPVGRWWRRTWEVWWPAFWILGAAFTPALVVAVLAIGAALAKAWFR